MGNVTVSGASPNRTVMESQNATISISAPNITFINLDFLGSWSVQIAPNCSLLLRGATIDQLLATVGEGGALTLHHSTVARRAPRAVAMRVLLAPGAALRVGDTAFADAYVGGLLSVAGDAAAVALDNVTMRSGDPALADLQTAANGVALAGAALRATIARSSFAWLGLRAVSLDGSDCALDVSATAFFQNAALSGFLPGEPGGGAVAAVGPRNAVRLRGCALTGQWSDTAAGGVLVHGDNCSLTVEDSQLRGNSAGLRAGAVGFYGDGGTLAMVRTEVRCGAVPQSAAIAVSQPAGTSRSHQARGVRESSSLPWTMRGLAR